MHSVFNFKSNELLAFKILFNVLIKVKTIDFAYFLYKYACCFILWED